MAYDLQPGRFPGCVAVGWALYDPESALKSRLLSPNRKRKARLDQPADILRV